MPKPKTKRKKIDPSVPHVKWDLNLDLKPMVMSMNIDVKKVHTFHTKVTPQERQVWLTAISSATLLLPGADVKAGAEAKARFADEMLAQFRQRFMVVQYEIGTGISYEGGDFAEWKKAETAETITLTKKD